MRFRILRWIRAHATTGHRQYREIFIQARRLTIGRAADQHLQIADARVFPNHAIVRGGRGREGPIVIEALTPSGVRVNGKALLQKSLQPGDEIQIGPAIIVVESSPRGAPVTLRFRFAESEETGRRLDRLNVLSLGDSGLSKKFWSMMLASGVAAIFLLVPMGAAMYQPLRPLLRASALIPNDGWWTPGPLHTAHQFIGTDCNTCHVSPFTPVNNAQCAACHTTVQHHVPVPSGDMTLFADQRCADCHAEHSETRTLVSHDQRVCTDCHADLKALKPRTRLMNASDFGIEHPEFRLSMLESQPGRGGMDWETVRMDVLPGVTFVENSHLSFSHAQHLDSRGIKGPKGDEVLQCKDCHTPDASGRYMLPIKMETQCSRCHSLRFDESDPTSTVPHGDIEGVYRTLIAHFSQQYLEGVLPVANRGRSAARRPGMQGGVMTRDEQIQARDWAEQMSLSAARDLFEKRVCVDCHEVRKAQGQVQVSYQQWQVEPVRLTQQWMPQANFDHASHKTSRCQDCHSGAEISKKSSDVLMPTLKECRNCHAGPKDTEKTPSDCLMCHQFHLPNHGLFDQDATMRARSLPRTDAQRRMQASGRATGVIQ